jgi:ABC-type nitrate/sulfonate/bicarbonate transport system ATPase subunit
MNKVSRLVCEKIQYSTSGNSIFSELNLSIYEGEIVALLGPSGCGKTTLLKCMSGLLKINAGHISFNKTHADDLISFVPSSAALFSWLNIYENLFLAAGARKLNRTEFEEISSDYLRRAGLEGVERKFPHELSTGMAQRVSLICALISGASLVLMDEPFSGLDFLRKEEFMKFMLEVWRDHRPTIFFVTHDLEEAEKLADRVFLMDKTRGICDVIDISMPRALNTKNVESSSFRMSVMGKFRQEA